MTATDLFVDFLCPYAWRGVELAAVLRAQGETFRLRHFSLVQGNHPENAGQPEPRWWLTEQAAEEGTPYQRSSLAAFLAARAAAQQGEDAAWAYTLALFRARHEAGQPLDESSFSGAAQTAGLDLERWQAARADDDALRGSLREDLADAHRLGVFGTPTYVLPDGHAAYYRFEQLTRDPGVARERWNLYLSVLRSEAGIGTIKRTKPPVR
ncbi:DsbA family oxidoreductase [Deinococcus navajonensis]|uniref:DsbA family protein n=1 Tax=Deinococcus navajonensis TaxID=309884 RepID=A0ABV8XGQ5_9DEIO